MKCFNCGREYDEKSEKAACTLVCEETGEESEVKNIAIPEKGTLVLCPFCVRAVTLGIIEVQPYYRTYKFKDFEYQYMEEDAT